MTDLLTALGLVLVIEGCLYALAPGAMKNAVAQVLQLPDETVRRAGLAFAVLGLVIVWLIRG